MKVLLVLHVVCVGLITAKIYDPEVLRVELAANGMSNLDTWLCIIKYESEFNTAAHNPNGYHGLFQIGQAWWCSPPGNGCGVACTALRDDDITDDIACAKKVFAEGGWSQWSTWNDFCR